MRTRHWLTTIMICFLVLAGSTRAQAQYPGGPGHASIQTQGMPPGAYSGYPSMSPYEQGYSQTYNDNGTWFNDSIGAAMAGGPGRWTVNLDWVTSTPRQFKGLVGAPNTNTYLDNPDVAPADDDGIAFDFFNYFDPARGRNIGKMTQSGLRISGAFNAPQSAGFLFDVTYNPQSNQTYNAQRPIEALRYQIWDQPGTIGDRKANRAAVRQLLTGPDFLAADISPPFDWLLDTPPQTHQNDATESGLLQRNLYNLHGLPIDDGVTFGGVTVPYDLGFVLQQRHESFNVNLGFAMAPIINSGGLTVQPIVSGRYMYLNEVFDFRGTDSGLNYTPGGTPALFKEHSVPDQVDGGGDLIVDNAGVSDGTGGGGGGGGGAFIGGNASATPDTNWSLINPDGLIESRLNNAITTNLAGPEIALKYQLGETGGTTLSGQTRVGVMVNREKVDLRGNNIGNLLAFDQTTFDPNAGGTLTDMFPTNGDLNRFRDQKETTHLSPLFEQSFQAQVPLFANVPLLRRIRQLQGASLRAGYTFLWIGEVASPNKSILWQANPRAGLFPKIKLQRDAYYIGSWNFGVNWEF